MNNIVNVDNLLSESKNFQERKPTKWAFIENFIEPKLYEELYDTFPKLDNSWFTEDSYDKLSFKKFWITNKNDPVIYQKDNNASNAWNKFMEYIWSDEFVSKLREFSGVPVTRLKYFSWMMLKKDGFQMPHIHNVGPSTLLVFIYFSKNWKKGDPGGTYLSRELDESTIEFEPYNLDNTSLIVQDGPHAAHGARRVIKDVERKAIQLYFENWTEETGWSEIKKETELIDL